MYPVSSWQWHFHFPPTSEKLFWTKHSSFRVPPTPPLLSLQLIIMDLKSPTFPGCFMISGWYLMCVINYWGKNGDPEITPTRICFLNRWGRGVRFTIPHQHLGCQGGRGSPSGERPGPGVILFSPCIEHLGELIQTEVILTFPQHPPATVLAHL